MFYRLGFLHLSTYEMCYEKSDVFLVTYVSFPASSLSYATTDYRPLEHSTTLSSETWISTI